MKGLNVNAYGPWQWVIFRVIFGIYLTTHFVTLIPYAEELFSPKGMIKSHEMIPTFKIFPNILNFFSSGAAYQGFLLFLTLLSIAITIGFARKWAALLLWYGHACLFNANIFIANPSLPYVGWLLLACVVIREGEPASVWPRDNRDWKMNPWLFYAAWIILAIGYTFSGVHKYAAESWQNGRALIYVMELPTTRDWWFKDMILNLPEILLRLMTWGTLALEILFLPLCLYRPTRILASVSMALLHLGILTTVCIADLTFGMIMIHLFVVEPDWGSSTKGTKVVFFDGVCGLCDKFITFLVDADTMNVHKLSPQQREAFKQKEIQDQIPKGSGESVFYWKDGKITQKSTAVLQIMSDMGGLWKIAVIFKIIPEPLRDVVYDFIATHRYQMFGKKDACRLPTPAERAKFLD